MWKAQNGNNEGAFAMEENIFHKMFPNFPMFGWSKYFENIFSAKTRFLENREMTSLMEVRKQVS